MQINGDELAIFLYFFKNIDNYLNACEKHQLLKFDTSGAKDYKFSMKARKMLSKIQIEHDDSADEEFVNLYISIFKENGKSLKPGVAGNKKLVKEKLNDFLKNNKYTKNEILQAIQNYVNSQRQSDFRYLQKAHYTVSKMVAGDYESKLLDFCEELGDEEEQSFKSII